ncbi:hypothetical protein [Neorhizobium sp. DAR64872/K0K18]|uniref:hypothetical protein n=1 Tax=Neorhizobium sp. DAR64872/K0K18 TaxID=3421958 RepID=UPI003D2DEFE5
MFSRRSNPARLMREADAARDSRAWERAVQLYSNVTERAPRNSAAWVQLGNCAKECHKFSIAANAYARAITLDPGNEDTYLQLGHLKKITGNIVDALWAYSRSDSIKPGGDAAREIRSISSEFQSFEHRIMQQLIVERPSIIISSFEKDPSLTANRLEEASDTTTLSNDKLDPHIRAAMKRFLKILTGG